MKLRAVTSGRWARSSITSEIRRSHLLLQHRCSTSLKEHAAGTAGHRFSWAVKPPRETYCVIAVMKAIVPGVGSWVQHNFFLPRRFSATIFSG